MWHDILLSWKDSAVLLCLALILLAAAALATAAHGFVIIRGRVLSTGAALVDGDRGEKVPTRTVTVIIENTDRVYRIQRGTMVEYAVSDGDSARMQAGSEVELLISYHESKARLVRVLS